MNVNQREASFVDDTVYSFCSGVKPIVDNRVLNFVRILALDVYKPLVK